MTGLQHLFSALLPKRAATEYRLRGPAVVACALLFNLAPAGSHAQQSGADADMTQYLSQLPAADQAAAAATFSKLGALHKDQAVRGKALLQRIDTADHEAYSALKPAILAKASDFGKYKEAIRRCRALRNESVALSKKFLEEKEAIVQSSSLKPDQKKSSILGIHDHSDPVHEALVRRVAIAMSMLDALQNIIVMAEANQGKLYVNAKDGTLGFKSEDAADIYNKNAFELQKLRYQFNQGLAPVNDAQSGK